MSILFLLALILAIGILGCIGAVIAKAIFSAPISWSTVFSIPLLATLAVLGILVFFAGGIGFLLLLLGSIYKY